jgi:potassium-transporting ATPase potassium-binding subunit
MNGQGWLQIVLFLGVVLVLVRPLGAYMARVFEGAPIFGMDRALRPVERFIYKLGGIDPKSEMTWKRYAASILVFSLVGFLLLYLLQRVQGWLPGGPEGMENVRPDLAFNTAVSFVTNTNWQAYGGETTMKYVTQMLGMTVQNFVSAGTGIAVVVAFIRGFSRRSTDRLGNFWVDLTRSVLYVLLPLSFVFAIVLVSQGVVQTLGPAQEAHLVQSYAAADGGTVTSQTIAVGPVASQLAIKELGTNGGGFFNANSAHPFENPTPLTNFLQLVAILLIPASLCYTFGRMVGNTKQGWVVLAVMMIILVAMIGVAYHFEQQGVPQVTEMAAGLEPTGAGADSTSGGGGVGALPGGNMEGKEVRFGIPTSAAWAVATTGASNGSVNSMHDSLTPLGGMAPLLMIQLGEVVFGGVGSGLYVMLVFAIVAVFIAGLMVGRTPEYLGKKIETYEMKMASLIILIPVIAILAGTMIGVATEAGRSSIANPGAHGLSEVLYAFTSAVGNNGSAFAGLSANTPFYNIALAICMLIGRFWILVPTLALAGSLAQKKHIPAGAGTLRTDGPVFAGLLIVVVIVVGALSFLPALALGPIVEHLMMIG